MIEKSRDRILKGNVFIFQGFDVGEDINLDLLKRSSTILVRPLTLAKYFKNYHTPLPIDLPHPHSSSKFMSASVHSFGVISLIYKIPFEGKLEELHRILPGLDAEFQEQAVTDAGSIFRTIKYAIKQPKFFHLRTSYVVIQINPIAQLSTTEFKEHYGNTLAGLLRFETESLSEPLKNEILKSTIGYYKGNLIIVDHQATLIYDNEYDELLSIFEFVNIQQLELQYFDRFIDQELTMVYQREVRRLPWKTYLPLIGTLPQDPIGKLNILKVEISVIIERLESSIKLAGEEYMSEIYTTLVEKLDLKNWKEALYDKLQIIKDLNEVYQNRVDAIREDLLTMSIIILIMIELIVAILKG